jgi:hypothetical protein
MDTPAKIQRATTDHAVADDGPLAWYDYRRRTGIVLPPDWLILNADAPDSMRNAKRKPARARA